MKKVFAILLVLALVAGFVFADSVTATVNTGKQRLTVTSSVVEVVPQFAFYGTTNSDYSTSLSPATVVETDEGKFDGTTLASGKSIADEDITLYFIIKQTGGVEQGTGTPRTYARYNDVVTFTFVIGALTEQSPQTGKDAATGAGSLVANSAVAGTAATYSSKQGGDTKTLTNAIETTVSGQVFTSTYTGKVDGTQEIGRFAAIWNQDDTVPNGEYKADVTVTIAAN